MAYTRFSNGFEVTTASAIDKRVLLSKAQMLTAEDTFMLPDKYFCLCTDDGQLYIYNVNNPFDSTTGKFRVYSTGSAGYTAGDGIDITSNVISADNTIARVSALNSHNTDTSAHSNLKMYHVGQYSPTNKNLLWVDINGGIKYWDESLLNWVPAPVAFG